MNGVFRRHAGAITNNFGTCSEIDFVTLSDELRVITPE
jgi:hypothetical protein